MSASREESETVQHAVDLSVRRWRNLLPNDIVHLMVEMFSLSCVMAPGAVLGWLFTVAFYNG